MNNLRYMIKSASENLGKSIGDSVLAGSNNYSNNPNIADIERRLEKADELMKGFGGIVDRHTDRIKKMSERISRENNMTPLAELYQKKPKSSILGDLGRKSYQAGVNAPYPINKAVEGVANKVTRPIGSAIAKLFRR